MVDYHQKFGQRFGSFFSVQDNDEWYAKGQILAFIDEVVAEREAWWTDRMLREVERVAQITENKERALFIGEVNKLTSRLADCNKAEVSYSAKETGLCPSGYWNFGGKGCHEQKCEHCATKETRWR